MAASNEDLTGPLTSRPLPRRRPTRAVRVGSVFIGSNHPILIQSMTVSDTLDTEEAVAEIRELVAAGCPLVRLTVPSLKEAENLREIRRRLEAEGIVVPMVADIHFTPNAAIAAAEIVEKVRINPGNYADKKRFAVREYSEEEYAGELQRIAERLRPLIEKLRADGRALRIGVNHGSLSDRILNRFGDTPEGMVESALEFVRICEEAGFRDIVLSMKSSVPSVMIAAYRLLARRLEEGGLDYPIHLGVTEAGDGLDARIKSAIGIGSLLADGIGDTIRVSLTENSRHEVAAARAILEAAEQEKGTFSVPTLRDTDGEARPSSTATDPAGTATGRAPHGAEAFPWWWTRLQSAPPRRARHPWVLGGLGIGADSPIRVEARLVLPVGAGSTAETLPAIAGAAVEGGSSPMGGPARFARADDPSAHRQPNGAEERTELLSVRPRLAGPAHGPELIAALARLETALPPRDALPVILEWSFARPGEIHLVEAMLPYGDALSLGLSGVQELRDPDRFRLLARLLVRARKPVRWRIPASVAAAGSFAARVSELCHQEGLHTIGFLCDPGPRWLARTRDLAQATEATGEPIFLEVPSQGPSAALLAGAALLDGIGDSLCLAPDVEAPPWPEGGVPWTEDPVRSAYAVLQACRLRLTRAEFIACPSCGRTQFDLQTVTRLIRARTEHLKGVKIAIMGCVVNGPGEMADADFGYVGSGAGKVDLYVGRERVSAGLSQAQAPDRLVELIRARGRWVEPPASAEGSPSADSLGPKAPARPRRGARRRSSP